MELHKKGGGGSWGGLRDVNFQCLSQVPAPSDVSLRDLKGEPNLSKDGDT